RSGGGNLLRLFCDIAAADGNNGRARLQKQTRYIDRRGQDASRIAAEVQHEPGEAIAAELFDGIPKLLRGLLLEAGNADIADPRGQEVSPIDAWRLKLLRRQGEGQEHRDAGAPDIQARRLLPRRFE